MMEIVSLLAGLAIAIWIIAFPVRPYFKRPRAEQ
jgi:hypothetical protein